MKMVSLVTAEELLKVLKTFDSLSHKERAIMLALIEAEEDEDADC